MSVIIASGPIRLELNALLTVSGTLVVDRTGTLTFEPALDARLLGKERFQIPLFAIRDVRRMDGGRRIAIDLIEEADKKGLPDQSGILILRGGMAQQTYVILRAMLEWLDNPGTPMPRFFNAVAYGRLWHAPGVLAVGPLGMGFGSSIDNLLTGALSTSWTSIANIRRIRAEYPGIHIDSDEVMLLECETPLVVRDLLVERWLRFRQIKLAESRVLTETPEGPKDLGPWQKEAIRWKGLDANLGILEIVKEGLVFKPAGDSEESPMELLLPRKRAGEMFVEESEPSEEAYREMGIEARLSTREDSDPTAPNTASMATGKYRFFGHEGTLVVGTNEEQLARLTVSDPESCLFMLEELVSSPEWFPQDGQGDPKLAPVTGPSAYTSVWHGQTQLATRQKVAVAPFSGKLVLKLDAVVEPPILPTGVRVEIANAKSRFLVTGLLTEWVAPDSRRVRPNVINERTMTIVLEDEIISANRRENYRLPVQEKIPRVQLQPPPPKGRSTFPMPTEIENCNLLELSRKGACILLPMKPDVHTLISFLIASETEKEKQDKKKLRGKRQVEEEKENERNRVLKLAQEQVRKEAHQQDRLRSIQLLNEIQSDTGEETVLDINKVGSLGGLIPDADEEATVDAFGDLEREDDMEPDTEEHFLIRGRVIYAMPVNLTKDGPPSWRCGLAVYEDCDGTTAFIARQRVFLRQRSEERHARGM